MKTIMKTIEVVGIIAIILIAGHLIGVYRGWLKPFWQPARQSQPEQQASKPKVTGQQARNAMTGAAGEMFTSAGEMHSAALNMNRAAENLKRSVNWCLRNNDMLTRVVYNREVFSLSTLTVDPYNYLLVYRRQRIRIPVGVPLTIIKVMPYSSWEEMKLVCAVYTYSPHPPANADPSVSTATTPRPVPKWKYLVVTLKNAKFLGATHGNSQFAPEFYESFMKSRLNGQFSIVISEDWAYKAEYLKMKGWLYWGIAQGGDVGPAKLVIDGRVASIYRTIPVQTAEYEDIPRGY